MTISSLCRLHGQYRQRGISLPVVLGLIAVFVILLPMAYTWVALTYSYSAGERAGYVQKFSRKGWVCKTWEGDLALVNLPGQPAEIFPFSVRDDMVAGKINALVGKRVSLTYEQHIGVPTSCFGETQYFVTDIHVVE